MRPSARLRDGRDDSVEKRNESQYTNVYYVTVRTFDYGTTYYAGIYTSMSLNVGTCWRTN